MARRRYGRRRGRHSKPIRVISLGIAAAQVADAWLQSGGDAKVAASRFVSYYTGFAVSEGGAFIPSRLLIGYGPWIAMGFIMKLARGVGARPRLFPGLSLS